MRRVLGIGITALICAVYFVSPYWALAGLSRAAIEHRVDDFATYIDMPAIREDISHHVSIDAHTPDGRSDPMGQFIAAGALEKIASPEVLAELLSRNLTTYAGDSRIRMTWGLLTHGNLTWTSPGRVSLGQAGSMRRTILSWRLDRFGQSEP